MNKSLKLKISLISIAVTLLLGGLYYYVALPAVNIHSKGFWEFIILLFVILTVTSAFLQRKKLHFEQVKWQQKNFFKVLKQSKITYALTILTGLLIVVFLIGALLSSPIVNAKKYQQLINIKEANFHEDIQQISYNEIPLLDRASASLLGSRKMGSMVEYVSQFEVSDHYTQINYNNRPLRVTPLKYGNIFKWLTNRGKGIPAYITIDMATQNVECVKLTEGMKYTDAEHFGRYIYRYLRFRYPTYIFDTINFEIDDQGVPYWICPAKDYTIGLFGGETIKNVVIVNAVTGAHKNYKIDQVPTWVDRVYSSELLVSYYDYYGSLKHGYLNTLFSQKDCLQTTEGYNYIALDDDVWMYTGVTSVGGDESLVGFILSNQRTAETKYYSISGAKEYSAMQSAEGKVQHLGYKATFPLLLNVANEPTYVLTLKD
ncbi:MAG: CvpA family protein, partial [Clostridium sp.]|nr:CvpA family protein [Clostridium sp.]